MKKIKILFDYSPLCRGSNTGIPIFVKNLYTALYQSEEVVVKKTFCFCNYISTKHWKVYRLLEQLLYHNIYLPFKLVFGRYDVYVENQYMFIPIFKPKRTLIVTVLYDIALAMYDNLHTKTHIKRWRKNLPKSIHNSDLLLTISGSSKLDIEVYLKSIQQQDTPVEHIYIDAGKIEKSHLEKNTVLNKYHIDQKYFLFLGTLEPRKNPLNLIKAFHLYRQRTNSNMQLVFAGKKGWLYDDVLAYVRKHKMEDSVIFTGFVSDAEKYILLKYTSAFLFLSIYEGFGIPVLEALRLNVPCLVSDIPVFHELFGSSIHYVDPNNIHDIATNMQKILLCPPRIDAKGLQKFSWEASANRFVDILQHYVSR